MKKRSFSKQIFFAVLTILLVLIVFESLSRIWNTVSYDIRTYREADRLMWYAMSPEIGWVRRPNYKGVRHDGARREFDPKGYNLIDSKKIAPSPRKKILFFGDSRTFGYGVPAESTFVQLAEEHLSGVDCINLAVPGYTTYQGLQSLRKDGLPLHPDVMVVSFAYNDRLCVSGKENADGREHFQKLYALSQQQQIVHYAEMLYLTRSLKRYMTRLGLLSDDFTEGEQPIESLSVRVSKDDYRRNLVSIVNTARDNGIRVVFLILDDNPVQTEFLEKGNRSMEAKDYTSAVMFFKTAQRSSVSLSLLAKSYLSKAYEKAGLHAEAMRVSRFNTTELRPRGGPPLFLDKEYSQIMRDVARDQKVAMVDAAAILKENPAVFLDDCHFDVEGHRIVTGLLLDVLQNVLAGGSEELSSGKIIHLTSREKRLSMRLEGQ